MPGPWWAWAPRCETPNTLPHFMKTLKQRFSQWFNPRQEKKRTGTLWRALYRRSLVEDPETLCATVMLIEQRLPANMKHFPKDFRWCSCAHAESTGSTSLIRVNINDARMLSGDSPASRLTTSLYSLT